MENPFITKTDIFSGDFKLITEEIEVRMSHWVKIFGIADKAGNWILPIQYSLHLEKYEESESLLKVNFLIYPNPVVEYHVQIDPYFKLFSYNDQMQPLENFSEVFRREDES